MGKLGRNVLVTIFYISTFLITGCGLGSSFNLKLLPSKNSPEKVSLSIPDIELQEGSPLLVMFSMSKSLSDGATLSWTLQGTDVQTAFAQISGTSVINPGQGTGTFTISSVNDNIFTGVRNFKLKVSLESASYSLSNSEFNVRVVDLQSPVSVTLAALSTIYSGNVINYNVSGTCSEDLQDVSIEARNSGGTLTEIVSCNSGSWSALMPPLSGLAEGNVTFVVKHKDAGLVNEGIDTKVVLKDVTPPGNPTPTVGVSALAYLNISPSIIFSSGPESDLDFYEAQVYAVDDDSVVAVWRAVTPSDSLSGLSLTSEKSYYVKVRAVDIYGNKSSGANTGNWIADTTGPSAPTGLAFEFKSLSLVGTGPIQLASIGTDGGVGVAKTQLRLVTSADVTVVDWVDNALLTSYKNSQWYGFVHALIESDNYKIQARSIDNLENIGQVAELAFEAKTCGEHYLPIYPLASASRPVGASFPEFAYPTQTFCVAKFEMKRADSSGVLITNSSPNYVAGDNHRAISVPGGVPWYRQITQAVAKQLCVNKGEQLITNAQWQTMARHIASVNSNWSTNTVNTGHLNIGNYANTIDSQAVTNGLAYGSKKVLAAASATVPFDDNNGYVGMPSAAFFPAKRTHNLPWNQIIWDVGGNLAEWTRDVRAVGSWVLNPTGTLSGDVRYQTVSQLDPSIVDIFGLTGNFSACTVTATATWQQPGNPCHLGDVMIYQAGESWTQAFARGSHYENGEDNGIFRADGNDSPTYTSDKVGFRCVKEGL